ncbi:filamentous hemagglutinin N-terminal domain-containing protein [Limnothrix sp. FACHB-881]|uniref:two-partner secretion domain-containing protein n=1 Tax=Limnothrix sp. FACHB-881 TaxID=2692819 RepID=UPI001681ED48|nr:filamentous hemagglutinin N-terminal domain-containing protein [Limnothrix sp. FACHB-881]MBD2635181.1 filamentous hemagglutinin N-terminal domain-containing protein [Limnothrix sp. FACHB-881]
MIDRLRLGTIITFLLWTTAALAQEIVPAQDGVQTQIRQDGNQIIIGGGTRSGNGANLFHSFERFNVNSGQIANFLSQPDIQNILGRVTGGDASIIDGLIRVSGGSSNLYLMNPAGIVFGANARLDIPASFTATTANAIGFGGDRWFESIGSGNWANLVGSPIEFRFDSLTPGSLINAGSLSVGPGADLSLIGGNVVTVGTLNSPGGRVTITAVPGQNLVRITPEGSVLSLEIPSQQLNAWAQSPRSLPELLAGQGISGLPTEELPAAGTAIASGRLNVSGETGGRVAILGDRVALWNASIDASGQNGGGTVLVGGEQLGLGPEPNALFTLVNENSSINVSATDAGNGGRAIVWSDQGTRFWGQAIAQGGPNGGNGGLIETSGKLFLDVAGSRISASAPFGLPGTWLLDPTDITISSTPTTGGSLAGSAFTIDAPAAPATANINNAQLAATLDSGTSVTISTASTGTGNGDITVTAPVELTTPSATPVTLTLQADRNIVVNSNITSADRPLNITLTGDQDNNLSGAVHIQSSVITTSGGNFNATGHGSETITRGVWIQKGLITLSGGNLMLRGIGGELLDEDASIGVQIDSGSQIRTTNLGTIEISGIGGGRTLNRNANHGITIIGFSTITSEAGDIIFKPGIGGGSPGSNSAFGIELRNLTLQATNGGNIVMEGSSLNLSSGEYNSGIWIAGSEINTYGNGEISLIGTAGERTNHNDGVFIGSSKLTSESGGITINGIGAGSGFSNSGVEIVDTSSLTSGGTITLIGISSDNSALDPTDPNLKSIGVDIRESSTVTGSEVVITGTDRSNVTARNINSGVNLASSASVTATGFNGIQITGIAENPYSVGVTINGSLGLLGSTTSPLVIEGSAEGSLAVDINRSINLTGLHPVTITADQDIETRSITTGSIDITSTQGLANLGGTLAATNNIAVRGRSGMSASSATASNGAISLESAAGTVQVSGAITSGNSTTVRGQTGIIVGSVAANNSPIELTSRAGNIRVTGTNSTGACAGSSLCTNDGAAIDITHGGLNDFIVGNSTTNGTAGSIFNGITTLSGLTILNRPGTYQNGQLSVTPGFVPAPTTTPTPSPDPLAST